MSDQPLTRAELRERRERAQKAQKPPKPGKSGRPKKGWSVRRVLKIALLTGLTCVILGVAGVAVAYEMTTIPKPNQAALAQASTIYYSDGKTVMDRIATVNRESVPLSKVPDHVQKAFLAAEDRNFYQNSGISPKGIARAIWVGLTGGAQQGGSTITQQYVKNYFLTQNRTISRKVREVLISIKIDQQRSKDQILESYLNTIYFGRGADGIQTASKAYFGKDVSQLTVSEGALLASVIRGPSLYDPQLGPTEKKAAEARWHYVIDGMLAEGWITQKQHDEAKFPATKKEPVHKGLSGPIGYVVQQVRNELHNKLKLTDSDMQRGGFNIVTTIDKKQEDAAIKAVKDNMPTGKGTADLHVGLVSIQPGDGAIRAMYGGKDFGQGKAGFFNTAVDAKMQAGSTFKVFTLLGALQKGMPLWTKFDGKSPIYLDAFKGPSNPTGKVENYANEQFGKIDLITATKDSVNTVYAPLNVQVGPGTTSENATKAGVTTKLDVNAANVLGTDSVRVVDMANAYATIAAQGQHATPYLIKSITSSGSFKLDYTAKPEVKQVFDRDVVRDAMKAMSAVISPGGTGGYALKLGRPAGGKTGTTSGNYAAWFDGFTPGQLATAVGMYRGDGGTQPQNQMNNIPGVGELTGGTVPVRIWTSFMQQALQGQPVAKMPPPGHIGGFYTPTPTSTSSSSTSSSSTSSTTSSATSTTSPTSTKTNGTGKPTPSSTLPPTTSSTTSSTSPPTSSSSTKTHGTGSPTSTSTTASP